MSFSSVGRSCVACSLLLGSLLCSAVPSVTAETAPPELVTLTIGTTGSSITAVESRLRPIAAHLARRLDGNGIDQGRVTVFSDPPTLARAIREGKVDVVIDTLYPSLVAGRDSGARPLLATTSQGRRTFYSHVFVHRESGINDLDGLRGKTVALGSRASTLEYFLPLLLLEKAGLRPVEIPSAGAAVPKDRVGYVFAGDNLNIATWVYYRKVDAGFLGNCCWGNHETNPEAYRREFAVIHDSEQLPGSLVSVRGDLDRDLARRLKDELLKFPESEQGKRALQASGLDRFEEIEPAFLAPFESLLKKFLAGRGE